MENFISKIKKTAELFKKTPTNIHKEIIKKTSLGLNRSMPQPNPIDNTISEVHNYQNQKENNNKVKKDIDNDIISKPNIDRAA